MKGIYVFKQNGKEIARSENIITANGKETILQYLAGTTLDWASHMAVGAIVQTSIADTNTTLDFEIARTPVTLKSYSTSSPKLTVMATLDETIIANIYEIGIYPIANNATFGQRNNLIISDFSVLSNWSATAGGPVSTNEFLAQSPTSPRLGAYSINIPESTTYTSTNVSFNFSNHTVLDTVDLLIDNVVGTGNVSVTFGNNAGDTETLTYSLSTNSSYQVVSQNVTQALIDLGQITSLSIVTPSSFSFLIDAIKASINNEVNASSALVSRSELTTPIAKLAGTPLDIEYYLDLT